MSDAKIKCPFLATVFTKGTVVHLAVGAVLTGIVMFAVDAPARAEKRRKDLSAYMSHRTGA